MPEVQDQSLNLQAVTELSSYKPEYLTLMIPTEALEELAKMLKGIILDAEAIAHDADNVDNVNDVYGLVASMGDVARNIIDRANNALSILREVFGA